MITKLKYEQIRVDGDTQPRAQMQLDVVNEYAAQMRAGDSFPPITVFFDGMDYWLADGFHRLGAALQARPDSPIEAEVFQGTQSDAQWYSFGANKAHGLHRKAGDKERAIRAALRHPQGAAKSDREIAAHVGVDHKTISKYRAELESVGEIPQLTRREGQDGKKYRATHPEQQTSHPRRTAADRLKPSRHMAGRVQKPTRAPNPAEKMTGLSMPHNPTMAARTLVELFEADYLRALVQELSEYLAGLPQ